MAKTDVKCCKYKGCKHPNATIDVRTDAYELDGKKYYHKDCFEKWKIEQAREEKVKADMQLIKHLWLENISQTVSISHLFKILNEYMDNGVDSDYLAFVMMYIVNNHMKLRYPQGFTYYVDRQEIKDAYRKHRMSKMPATSFKVTEPQDEVGAHACATPRRVKSFGDILGGK